ncbi:Uncharacterised protein [Shigella sonnei]|nr:Uncharacterised protein [Shigella sonnei]SYR78273.1 Uncharacterised protein [Klebsiella pneumoniae]SJA00008.1 Uncharacterised protein [Shigella sonnei]SJA19210.1 Uncharacterised protein [Shigella sonnei]SJA36351.1 Uncharacterised protein [Shigella sonnei]
MPVSPIEIKGIHNIAAKDPVNQVAHGATEDKTVSDGFSFMTIFKDQLDQKNRDHYRDSDKKVALPASTIRKKTECGTGIPYVYPVKE